MGKKIEVMQQKSPAEFFAENKNIAGFDNVSFESLNQNTRLHGNFNCTFPVLIR